MSYREAREKIESGYSVGVFYPNDSDPSIWYEKDGGEWVAHHRVGDEERGQDAQISFQRDGSTGTATFRVLEGRNVA